MEIGIGSDLRSPAILSSLLQHSRTGNTLALVLFLAINQALALVLALVLVITLVLFMALVLVLLCCC